MSTNFEEAIEFSSTMFQISKLREQKQAFFDNKNVYFSALIGNGKSLIFQMLPIIVDLVNGDCISTV